MAVISIHLTSADAPGTLGCLDPRKCPRANPSSTPWSPKNRRTKKKTLGNSDFTAPRYQQYHHWVQRWTQNNSDLKRHSLRFEDSYRLKPSQVRELLEAGQEVTLERYPTFTLRYMVFSVEHPNMILWKTTWKNNCTSETWFKKKMKKQLHIRKASSAKGPSAHHRIGPMLISCHKVLHSFIFKAIAYLPASLSTPCGLQPISWLSWSQWWALCLPWRKSAGRPMPTWCLRMCNSSKMWGPSLTQTNSRGTKFIRNWGVQFLNIFDTICANVQMFCWDLLAHETQAFKWAVAVTSPNRSS